MDRVRTNLVLECVFLLHQREQRSDISSPGDTTCFFFQKSTHRLSDRSPQACPPSSSLVSTAEREWAAAAPLPSSGRSSGGGRDRTPPRTRPRHSEELVAASDVGLVPSLCHEARGFFPSRFATTALSLGVTLAQFFHFLVIFGDQDSNCSHCRERRAVGWVGAVTEASGRGDVRVTPQSPQDPGFYQGAEHVSYRNLPERVPATSRTSGKHRGPLH